MSIRLVFPMPEHKAQAIDYIAELRADGSECSGTGRLENFLDDSSYEAWLDKVRADMDIANIPVGRVPALTYFCMNDSGEIAGMVNIRLALNDFLRSEGGHIGYSVRPRCRGRHYATEMLREAVRVCSVIGLNRVIVTCDKENIASAKVIRNCGGVLDAEFFSEFFQETIQRYIICSDKI